LSPQNRRGRATPPAHGRPAPKKPAQTTKPAATTKSAATTKPAATTKAAAADELDEPIEAVPAKARPRRTTPGVKRRGLARVQRSSGLRSAFEYVRAYIPLFGAFIVIFAGYWAWTTFGPHTPTPKENWEQITAQYMPLRIHDLEVIGANTNNFDAQIKAYQQLHDDMQAWMTALSNTKTWTDDRYTDTLNANLNTHIGTFVAYGNSEVTVLASIVLAQTPNDVLARKDELAQWEAEFEQAYEQVYIDFYTQNVSSFAPTLAFPPGTYVPTPSPAPSVTPSPSSTASPAVSGSPGVSASPVASPASS
jgi:hypothetical protein